MSDVFISYKREDETRVEKIAYALEAEGLDVWWDRELPGGESWRVNIEKALHQARCVVVVWSKASVAPEGHFVRDEAGHALAKGLLVPVFIDIVDPPVGFREIQAVDLTHWDGNSKDPLFRELVAAIRANLDGVPAPRAKGPASRRFRSRLTGAGLLAAIASIGAVIVDNPAHIVTKACMLAGMQPGLSDTCGYFQIGGRPTREERLFWEARRPGSCADLRTYIDKFHDRGTYREEANAMLTARRIGQHDTFVPGVRKLPLYVMQADTAAPTETASRAKALAVARAEAERNCRSFAQTTLFRFVSANVDAQRWRCETIGVSSVACSIDGQAICKLDERRTTEAETCGQ